MKTRGFSMILLAGLLTACASGSEREATDVAGNSRLPVVELTGCIGVSPGIGEMALRDVRFPDDAAARAAANIPGITENAWVRLEGDAVASMTGQHVRLRGEVIDSGRNTLGTAGVSGYETPSGDRSQADSDAHYALKLKKEAGRIARESLANGSSAKLRVIAVERTGSVGCDVETESSVKDPQ